MKYGSITIYGKNVINEFPEFNIDDIPLPEGFRFLMNRLSLMIMHMPYSSLKKTTENNQERIINFNMKTALSCAEALLLYSKKFVASYKKRSEIFKKTYEKDFPELYKKIPHIANLVDKYTKQKLKPNYKLVKSFIDDWFILRDYSAEILKFLLFKFTGKKAGNIEELSQIINKIYPKYYLKEYIKTKLKVRNNFLLSLLVKPANLTLNLLYTKRISQIKKKIFLNSLKHPFIPPDLKLFPATVLFIFALNKQGKINQELFNKARIYFNQVYPDNSNIYKNTNWEEMRKDFGTAFNIYGFQKLI